MLSQLILLPIQIRTWGTAETAAWYTAVAMAMITSVVDCGLRTAGHAEIVRYLRNPQEEVEARQYFEQVWAWIRLLVCGVTIVLIAGDTAWSYSHGIPYPTWKAALAFAFALETILIVRIMYLDTLGAYRSAEASYFVYAALRLLVSVAALFLLHVGVEGLGWIFLGTSIVSVLLQERMCKQALLLGIFAPLPRRLSLSVLMIARYTLAEPLANWVRLSLPVVIVAKIGSPVAVTTYVALRAAFGAARMAIQQLARVGSVEYLRLRSQEDNERRAESVLTAFVLLAGFFGVALSAVVILDNFRGLALWLLHADRVTFQFFVLAFALSAPFYGYQIPLSLMFRVGELWAVAKRQYAYILCSGCFALWALAAESLVLYLVLIVISELLLSALFLLARLPDFQSESGRRGLFSGLAGSLVILLLWWATGHLAPGLFTNTALADFVQTSLVGLLVLSAFLLSMGLSNRDTLTGLLRRCTPISSDLIRVE